jgi:hypothetical protein
MEFSLALSKRRCTTDPLNRTDVQSAWRGSLRLRRRPVHARTIRRPPASIGENSVANRREFIGVAGH